jgi:hypothetical protein
VKQKFDALEARVFNLEAVSYPKSSSGQVISLVYVFRNLVFLPLFFFFFFELIKLMTNFIYSFIQYALAFRPLDSDSVMKEEKLEKVRLLIQVTNFGSIFYMRKNVRPL